MNSEEPQTENLFSYGTLQFEDVQLATFGRKLHGKPDALLGYQLAIIKIDDEEFVAKSGTADHRNLHFTGNVSDFVEGTVLSLTTKELMQADAYEPAGYERVKVNSKSGLNVWVYLSKPRHDSPST